MEKFIREYYTLITHGVEIMAAVTGLLLLSYYKRSAVKYFIYFLVYVAILEILGSYPRILLKYDFLSGLKDVVNNTPFKMNYWWFTIFWSIGSKLFYSFYYYTILDNKMFKKIIKFSAITFFLFSIFIILNNLEEFFNGRHFAITLFGAIIVLMCVLFYFIEMLNSDKILTFHKSFNFYVTATIFIWWLATVPLSFYTKYFNTADQDFVLLKYVILLFSNIFMYGVFTFALIWCRPQQKD